MKYNLSLNDIILINFINLIQILYKQANTVYSHQIKEKS
jgi:hypothetical protein